MDAERHPARPVHVASDAAGPSPPEREQDDAFRMLSLDGGGMRGIFASSFLAEVEERLEHPVIDRLDLLVGTSTGGLIALALAAGHSAGSVLDLYLQRGAEIFHGGRHVAAVRGVFGPRYRSHPLGRILQELFGDGTMGELHRPVCVPAYEAIAGTARVFKGSEGALSWMKEIPVWRVAAATCAAPTFFAPVTIEPGTAYVDGGVWANNPVMVGISEAMGPFGRDLGDLRVMSVGTAQAQPTLRRLRSPVGAGYPQWFGPAKDLLAGAPGEGSRGQARAMLPDWRYSRFDDPAGPAIALDDVHGARRLQAVGRAQGRSAFDRVRRLLESTDANGRHPAEAP